MSNTHIVATTDDLNDGEMTSVEVNGKTILLLRLDGTWYAYPGECPHHGAPLADGLLHDGHVLCPWHQAIYDARTGALQEPPSLDGLKTLPVRIDGQNVIVDLSGEDEASAEPEMVRADTEADARRADVQYSPDDHPVERIERTRQGRTFVIVGGGAAGHIAAEAMRQEGFQGNITILTAEQDRPYDRTELSKRYLAKPDTADPYLRPESFYERYDVRLITGCEVEHLDIAKKHIRCREGSELTYDRVLLATGSRARRLDTPGQEEAGVLLLRSLADARDLRARSAEASQAVVVGASFLSMEVCGSLTERGVQVSVVAPESVPLKGIFGKDIGRMYQSVHESKGTQFHLGHTVKEYRGENGTPRSVVLDDGTELPADLIIMGVGAEPVTDYVDGLTVNEDGSIPVDRTMRAADDVWAAGDIASFPLPLVDQTVRIEHWRLAQQLGHTAGVNMAGREQPYRGVPFFWTQQHMVITDMLGWAGQWDEIVYDGVVEEQSFLAFYLTGGLITAVAGCGRAREMCQIREVLYQGGARNMRDFAVAANKEGLTLPIGK